MKSLFLTVLLLLSFSFGQNLSKLPVEQVNKSHGFITVQYEGHKYHYLEGIGWLEDFDGFNLKIIDGQVFVESLNQAPSITNIRYGNLFGNRIVLDISGLEARDLKYLIGSGTIERDEVLEIALPKLDYELGLIKDFGLINQDIINLENKTIFKLFGSDFEYRIFVLSKPTRLVIDFKEVFIAIDRQIKPGIIRKRFKTETAKASTVVDLLEINPSVGHFELAQAIGTGGKLKSLAGEAFLGINAGYFDTSNYQHIGLLKVGGELLSLPSRNRASFAFNEKQIIIDRVQTNVNIKVASKDYHATLAEQDSDIILFTTAGSLVGNENKAIILVQNSTVISNSFGPQAVPENGFAIVYKPIIPSLLEVKTGDSASYDLQIFPKEFNYFDNAVEAGPLLLKDFEDAYEPELEHFQTDSKILDSYTQQAAIGIKENGNIILLVADKMIAKELIPLLQSLDVKDAMRLDSGSSATLFANSKVLNRFFSRKIVTAIVFVLDE